MGRDAAEEIRAHIDLEADRLQAEGLPEREARFAARRAFGNATSVQERLYEHGRWVWLDNLRRDFYHAFRRLAKNWKLSTLAALSLGVALSLCVVALSLADRIYVVPPAAVDPDRLVLMHSSSHENATESFAYVDYAYLRDNAKSFAGLTAFPYSISISSSKFNGRDGFTTLNYVVGNYFQVLGMRPLMGRLFTQADEDARARVVVLTYAGWQRMGSDPNVVGKTIQISEAYTIVGVAPREFPGATLGLAINAVLPFATNAVVTKNDGWLTDHASRQMLLVGRLAPGATRESANAEMRGLMSRLAAAYPKTNAGRAPVLKRFLAIPPDEANTILLFAGGLLAVVLLVLLIASSNVANLLLALAVGRKGEALIKLASGASRFRLIREFLAESAIIVVAGASLAWGAAAFAINHWRTFHFALWAGLDFNFAPDLRLDGTVLAAMAALVCVTVVATGLGPALLYSAAPNLAAAINGETAISGPRKRRLRSALIAAQVAACTVTLIGAGLCLRSLINLRHIHLGFQSDRLAYINAYSDPAAKTAPSVDLLKRTVAGMAGVERVTTALAMPLGQGFPEVPVSGDVNATHKDAPSTIVDEDYFATMRIPVVAGRVFDTGDRPNTPLVAVVNRQLAETLWPSTSRGAGAATGGAVGQLLRIGDPAKGPVKTARVVGVVENAVYNEMDEAQKPFFYLALAQNPDPNVVVAIRTAGDPRLWTERLMQTVKGLHWETPLPPQTMQGTLDGEMLFPALLTQAAFTLGGIGLALAVIGIFGAISHSVGERKREFGVRVALGASSRKLLSLVLRGVLWIAGIGVAVGCALGVFVSVAVASQLYRVMTVEWPVLALVGASILAIALLAAWAGARRWLRVDPMEAVRHS